MFTEALHLKKKMLAEQHFRLQSLLHLLPQNHPK